MTLIEKLALSSLMDNPDIIIKNVYKGGRIVVLNKKDYLEEASRIPSDSNYYRPLLDEEYYELINRAHAKNILTQKEKEFLTIKNPKMPIFYYLLKIHKSLSRPTGRLIIAGINSLTSALSQYIDKHLQKYVLMLKSYLRDTMSVILKS